MKMTGVLALSTLAILFVGTVSAEAFERYSYGEFGGGLAENDFFGQPMENNLPGAGSGLAKAEPSYGYSDGFFGPTFGYSIYTLPAYNYARQPTYTGRSAAVGNFGKYCSTPIKSCLLYEPSMMGIACSCKVEGGRSHGNVTP